MVTCPYCNREFAIRRKPYHWPGIIRQCLKCGHSWHERRYLTTFGAPKHCPKCQTRYWQNPKPPRVIKIKGTDCLAGLTVGQRLLRAIFGGYFAKENDNDLDGAFILNLLGGLTTRERTVLEYRFAIRDGKYYTLREVGEIFGVTRERIRQIQEKSLRKLRHPSRSLLLRPYVTSITHHSDLSGERH